MSGEICQVSWHGQVARVALPAEVDVSVAAAVSDQLLDVIAQGATMIVADMSDTVFCDSAGVTALAVAHKAAASRGGKLRVATATPQVLRVLELTGLDLLIGVYPTAAQAIEADAASPADEADGSQALAGEGHSG